MRFVYYNLNPKGIKENDCVTRAIALATGLDYDKVAQKLYLSAELLDCEKLCVCCYKHLLDNVFAFPRVHCSGLSVAQFADLHPYGTYLIRVPSHLTVIRDGVLYDIWDCREEICDIAWKRVD